MLEFSKFSMGFSFATGVKNTYAIVENNHNVRGTYYYLMVNGEKQNTRAELKTCIDLANCIETDYILKNEERKLYDNEFMYKGKKYMLCEMDGPHWYKGSFDILMVFEVVKNDEGFDDYKMINYFYGASSYSRDEAEKIAKEYIDDIENEKE